MIKTLCSVLCVSILISGCSSEKSQVKTRTTHCSDLYTEVKSLFDNEEYFDVQENVNELLNTCTGTGVMEQAQFILAESYYNMNSWLEARSEYGIFVSHYPSSPSTEQALFKKALSSYNIDFVPGRDGQQTKNSLNDFNDFINQYPTSLLVDSANTYTQNLYERLASEQMRTAELYLTMGKPLAAAIYLKDFLNEFPSSTNVNTALIMLIECYTRIEQYNQAEQFVETLKDNTLTEDETSRYTDAVAVFISERETFEANVTEEREKKAKKKVEF
ncbi:MAG: outer membrane protein assembly factor BamD [Fibrobacterales bacterium]